MVQALSRPSFEAEWNSLPSVERISPRRSGHVAFTASPSPEDPVYAFGGYIEEEPEREGENFRRKVDNDLWKFCDRSKGWQKVEQSGDVPGPRLVSAAVAIKDQAFLFGGWDPQTEGTGGIILDSVHQLDLNNMKWKKVAEFPDGPTSRHVAVALPGTNTILIHNHRCLDHVWLFDTESKKFTKQPTSGDGPGSLGLHVATMVDENTMLVFGGAIKDGTMSNKSFLLDTTSWTWTPVQLEDQDKCPSPRAGACICSYSNDKGVAKCAVLFGGAEATETGLNPRGDVWLMHVGEDGRGVWDLVIDDTSDETSIIRPPPRNAATLNQISYNEKSAEFLLTGGWAPFRVTRDDVYVLSLKEK